MKNRFFLCLLVLIFLFCFGSETAAEKQEPKYPNAVYKLVIDTEEVETYSQLARSVGFEIGVRYGYREFVEIKTANGVGKDGKWEWLLLSTGGDENNFTFLERYNKEQCGWKMEYYSSHDLTMIYEICHDDSRTFSFVRILKLCNGRNIICHLE